MYGFEAITAHNGWSMAIVGASIDITGLFVLSIIIAQFPKLMAFLEKQKSKKEGSETPAKSSGATPLKSGGAIPQKFPEDIYEVAALYNTLIQELGGMFQLNELYKLAKERDYPHPHLTIRTFRSEGILVPEGDGLFTWNQ